ncbi:protease [Streptomyces venezuelae]|uniref:Protease n=1 Tax=Streptomyces venezuelae TaxID=54571 RepID=A0A5P2BUZ2_STRVZ|nr:trypsin-like peptidase domain-containing protein [Streptomyces venezuelae]QES34286.1 protease [Streptomyces venezuelae]
MDDGKPTKANWWSRPRPGTPDEPAPTHPADAPPDAPTPPDRATEPPAQPTEARTTPPTERSPLTDFPPTEAPVPGSSAAPGSSGEAPAQSSVQHPAEPSPLTDFTPDRPQAPGAPAAQDRSGEVSAQSGAAATWTEPGGQPQVSGGSSVPGEYASAAAGAGAQEPGGVERPRPLHDPDPYSTPPYGEPGPWAPAPPVQHPAATPAHGTQLPQPPHGGTTPPHGTPGPAPHLPQQPQPLHGGATPPHGTPGPGPHGASQAMSVPGQPGGGQGAPRQAYDPWNVPLQQVGSLPPETREKREKRGRRVLFIGVAVIALLSGLIGGATGAYLERNGTGDVELRQADAESADRPKGSVAGIASATLPGVVTLHVSGDSAQGTGTGFVLDGKGHILTNNHVVEPAGTGGEVSVTFSGGETAKAEVVGRDSGYDLAVVKVSGVRGLKPLPLGNSENVQVGDAVVAIGAPFDLENTVTSGIISAKERPITAGGEKGDGSDISYVDALQTDAPINPGNSGGPLVDSKARVIGINSAIRSADDSSEPGGGQAGSIGLGFAIPINQGKRVAEELINFGKATHPVIGVTLDTEFNGDGARIADKGRNGGSSVNENGPGDEAGLKPGDVITEVDGRAVHSSDELIVKVRAHRPKDRLRLTVERDGDDREVTLVLGSASSG